MPPRSSKKSNSLKRSSLTEKIAVGEESKPESSPLITIEVSESEFQSNNVGDINGDWDDTNPNEDDDDDQVSCDCVVRSCNNSFIEPTFDDSVKETLILSVPSNPISDFYPNRGSGVSTVEIHGRSITDLPQVLVSEIFHCLDAKELGIVSCVSTILYKFASDHHQGWKNFYCERWGLPSGRIPVGLDFKEEKTWRDLFLEREIRSRSYMGRYSTDVLYGHTEAVRSVFVLTSAKLIFSGGYDSVIRMWQLEDGLSIATSRHLGCTIRAVFADTKLLVAGGTDGFIQCWRSVEGSPHLFDLTSSPDQNSEFRVWEHEGPVTCLALDHARIYSGSWDMTVRLWDRFNLKCLKVLRHNDWVLNLVPRSSTVASAAGSDVYVWDIDGGDLVSVVKNAHVGNVSSLTRSHTGNLLFTGGGDGAVHMFEMTHRNVLHVASWVPHTGAVHSLSFEFPWLVSASSDGKLSLIDVRKLLRSNKRSSLREFVSFKRVNSQNVEAPQRMLHGPGCNLYSVSVGVDRIVCGGEEGVIRIWNFSQALEIEQRVQALRGKRLENRMRRRKVQMGINSKGSRADQCSVAAKKNHVNGERSGVWHDRRRISGKLKA